MNFLKTMAAIAALGAAMGAQAQVVGSTGGGYGTFLSLSSTAWTMAMSRHSAAAPIYTAHHEFAAKPFGLDTGDSFLAAGPSSGTSATLTFANEGVDYISFLWGSPDLYNQLTVTSTGGVSQTFTAAGLGFSVTNGDQSFSQYVQFAGSDSNKITSLSFTNAPGIDAFESANFTVTPVPEPQTYALLLAGLCAVGFMSRRKNP